VLNIVKRTNTRNW